MDERDELELRLEVERLKNSVGHSRWWNVAGGIASIIGSVLGMITLWVILTNLAKVVTP